jgi:hypothetical protein
MPLQLRPRPALQAAQKRAPEADPVFQFAQDRQLSARPERTTAIIPRAPCQSAGAIAKKAGALARSQTQVAKDLPAPCATRY